MKMKFNKRGFTLIELLVVIVILVVIMAIAIPSVTSSIERSKDKQKTQVKNLIVSAAELYYDSHKNSIEGNSISVKDLIDNGYLTKAEAKDPFDETKTVCGYVSINKNEFTFVDGTNCNCTESNVQCVSIE